MRKQCPPAAAMDPERAPSSLGIGQHQHPASHLLKYYADDLGERVRTLHGECVQQQRPLTGRNFAQVRPQGVSPSSMDEPAEAGSQPI